MSIIEQATKRLEELRRSTAVDPQDSPVASFERPSASTPTPEAFVHSLESRHAAVTELPATRFASNGEDRSPRQTIIDLARLKASGLISPDVPKSPIAE